MTTDQKLAEEYAKRENVTMNGEHPIITQGNLKSIAYHFLSGLEKGKELGRASMREEVKECLSLLKIVHDTQLDVETHKKIGEFLIKHNVTIAD